MAVEQARRGHEAKRRGRAARLRAGVAELGLHALPFDWQGSTMTSSATALTLTTSAVTSSPIIVPRRAV